MTRHFAILTFYGMPARDDFNDDPGVTLEEKVEALSGPDAYPHPPSRTIQAVETHMAWVFLTDKHVYKLQKPLRYEFLDLSTIELRKRNCKLEVHLNRRLAPEVYLGIEPLVLEAPGSLKIAVEGTTIDWLVKMVRLPRDRMLDRLLEKKAVGEIGVREVAEVLACFYRDAPAVGADPEEYRYRLVAEVTDMQEKLLHSPYSLPRERVLAPLDALRGFIETQGERLERRAESGRIKEGHGDLRPEHVCLNGEPVIIDCLQFNRELRVLDCVSDLALLDMECDRLDAPFVGEVLWPTYREVTGDYVEPALINFHKCFRACHRAQLAVRHAIGTAEIEKWTERAEEYLGLAPRYIPAFTS